MDHITFFFIVGVLDIPSQPTKHVYKIAEEPAVLLPRKPRPYF